MAGRQSLDLAIKVRILVPQPQKPVQGAGQFFSARARPSRAYICTLGRFVTGSPPHRTAAGSVRELTRRLPTSFPRFGTNLPNHVEALSDYVESLPSYVEHSACFAEAVSSDVEHLASFAGSFS